MYLDELIVQRRVGDRRQVKNRVEFFATELFTPIHCRQILRDEIATIANEILKITRAKIVNYREMRGRKFFLQCECEIRADKTGAAGDDEIGRRVQFFKTGIGER